MQSLEVILHFVLKCVLYSDQKLGPRKEEIPKFITRRYKVVVFVSSRHILHRGVLSIYAETFICSLERHLGSQRDLGQLFSAPTEEE